METDVLEFRKLSTAREDEKQRVNEKTLHQLQVHSSKLFDAEHSREKDERKGKW